MTYKLAQTNLSQTQQLPAPSQGQRVIFDERAPEVKPSQPSTVIPQSTYYWIGVIVLLVVAVVAATSFLANEKKAKLSNTDDNDLNPLKK